MGLDILIHPTGKRAGGNIWLCIEFILERNTTPVRGKAWVLTLPY